MSGDRVRLGLLRRTGFEWRAGCLIDDLLTTSCFPLSSLTGYYFSTSPHTVPHSSSIMNSTRLSTADGRTLRFSFFLFVSFLFLIQTWELEAKKLFSFATRWKRKQSDAMDFLYDVHRPLGRPTFFFWTTHGVTLVVMATVKTCWRFRPTTPSLAWPQNNATLEVMGLPGR